MRMREKNDKTISSCQLIVSTAHGHDHECQPYKLKENQKPNGFR